MREITKEIAIATIATITARPIAETTPPPVAISMTKKMTAAIKPTDAVSVRLVAGQIPALNSSSSPASHRRRSTVRRFSANWRFFLAPCLMRAGGGRPDKPPIEIERRLLPGGCLGLRGAPEAVGAFRPRATAPRSRSAFESPETVAEALKAVERRPQPLRHHSRAFWFVAIPYRPRARRPSSPVWRIARWCTRPGRASRGRSRSLACVSTRRSARRCVCDRRATRLGSSSASAPIRSAGHSTPIACEHHGANPLAITREARDQPRGRPARATGLGPRTPEQRASVRDSLQSTPAPGPRVPRLDQREPRSARRGAGRRYVARVPAASCHGRRQA